MAEERILIRKLRYDGSESWHWSGKLVQRHDGVMVIDALFNAPPRDLGYVKLVNSDLFHEFYYRDRCFNIYQIFSEEGTLKGWYCNICKRPACFTDSEISYVDMVLDVFVYPNGRTLVLDEEEFRAKKETIYSPEDARQAEESLAQLLEMVRRREHPFDGVMSNE